MDKNWKRRLAFIGHALIVVSVLIVGLVGRSASAADSYPNDRQEGRKDSPLSQINVGSVHQLEKAWEYHTGDISHAKDVLDAFEDEPSLIDGNLVICTTTRRLIALDPASGKQRWVFDPKASSTTMRKCRGVAAWTDTAAADGAMCKTRILLGTQDYRLLAIDSKTGELCPDFGEYGIVKMPVSRPTLFDGEISAGSRPAVVNGVVIVGSMIADDQRVEAPSGRVLAYDARSGKPVWQFDPIPRDATDPAYVTWRNGTEHTGAANVWSEMAVDEKLDLVYLPTTSPSVDFYGGNRPGDNHYADSIVALKGKTGEVAWSFQFTHHNIFDYDTPAQPILMNLPYNGEMTPALVQLTKTGLIWVFDRRTGKPLVPYVERPVPVAQAVPGETPSPTQPFPVGIPHLAPQGFSPDDAWGFTPIDRWLCKRKIEQLVYGPIYTPPSLKGTIFQPSVAGGPNWGGGAYDADSHLLVVPTNRVPVVVTLIPQGKVKVNEKLALENAGPMRFPNAGAPYIVQIDPLLSPLGVPCSAPPWAALTAVDLARGEIRWEVPLGSIDKLAKLPFEVNFGTPGAGGPLVTAGGLAFIGYTLDNRIRAFDLKTGKVLWKSDLPAAGNSTPVSYMANGEQYIVISAGGHSMYPTTKGDSVVAFKLKR